MFNGYLRPTGQIQILTNPEPSILQSLTPLLPYLKKYRLIIVFGILSVLLSNGIMLMAPRIIQKAVDALRNQADTGDMLYYGAAFLGVMIIQGVFRYYVRQTLGVVSRRIEFDLRNDIFKHVQNMTLAVFNRNKTGDIMSRATNDLQAVRMLLGPGIMYSFNAVVIFIAVMISMLSMDVKLTCVALIPMVILPLMTNWMSKRLYERSRAVQEQISELSGRAQEAISGIRVIKAYGRESSLFDQFRKSSRKYVERSMHMVKIQGAIWPLMGTIGGMSSVITVWYGGILVIEGDISLGALVAFEVYLSFLMWPLLSFGWVINIIQRGTASMVRINEMLSWETEVHVEPGEQGAFTFNREIEVKQLSFGYDGAGDVLHEISFKIAHGKTLAIIGPTGSGKTTLINLLMRLYDPPEGTVFMDGIDLLKIPLDHLRGLIGVVPQDPLLFSKSISDNIAYGKPEAVLEDIESAASIAHINAEIGNFPDGYETLVGERGVTLSGGQKQRTAIARAILPDPDILILDDALSSVDTYTEEKILNGLKPYMINRTSIIVAHRISTIKHADLILVINEGRIVESGDHGSHVAQKGLYADLNEKQLLQQALKDRE